MTQLHSSFQTVMQRRIVPAFMITLNAGIFLSLLIPRPAPLKVICIAATIQLIVCVVYYLIYQKLVFPAADLVVYENGAPRSFVRAMVQGRAFQGALYEMLG